MIVHRAAWVLPIAAPPIENGWVAVEHGLIVAVGDAGDLPPTQVSGQRPPLAPSEPTVILPALVNAHVHLELSWLRGAVPPASSLTAWVSRLIAMRRVAAADPVGPIRDAIDEARSFGTALVGDVTNTLLSYGPLAASALSASVFYEQLGFNTKEPDALAASAQATVDALPRHPRVRASVAPHAPYSVSPGLLRAIGALGGSQPLSIHLAESAEEVRFLADGTGAWRELLEALGVWDDAWVPPGCRPVEYVSRAGLLNSRLLAVHGVQLSDAELSLLAATDASLVTCPRSNAWTGAGSPPVQRFYQSGVRVAVGTDSLASAGDLNVFSELAAMRAAAPEVRAARLLESATRTGAEVLGFGSELGTIEPGKRAALIAVRVPAAVPDVEEYLVGGIHAADIRLLDGE